MRWGTKNVAKHRTSLWTALKGSLPLTRSLAIASHPTRAGQGPAPDPRVVSEMRAHLERDVRELAGPLAGRGLHRLPRLRACEEWLTAHIRAAGLNVERQAYRCAGQEVANYHATIPSTPEAAGADEVVVLGAHYDAVDLRDGQGECPAANDNGSGVASTLAILRACASASARGWRPTRRLRFSFWVNEEPPYFWTDAMGSLVDARARKAAGERIVAMLTPETLGCYASAPGTQHYPPVPGLRAKFGDAGDFVAFVGISESRGLVRTCVERMRARSDVRSAGAALPAFVLGVGASDHWSFWRCGYPALMVTDTAPFRYPFYHTPQDLPEKMDFAMMARVVHGLDGVVRDLAGAIPA